MKIEKFKTSLRAIEGNLSDDLIKTLAVKFFSDWAYSTLPKISNLCRIFSSLTERIVITLIIFAEGFNPISFGDSRHRLLMPCCETRIVYSAFRNHPIPLVEGSHLKCPRY